MNDPKCKRFHRKCDEFSLCVNIGEAEYVIAEHSNERYCVFYYVIKGRGKIGKLFDANYILAEPKKMYDVQSLMNDSIAFQALEDFHLIGFNTLDKSIKWGCKELDENNKTINLSLENNILLCLNGTMKINNKSIKRYDYVSLESNVTYNIDINSDTEAFIFYHL